jgi:hypothetical protein
MTDEERYIAQGRARDAAKKLRAEIATLRTSLDEYGQLLTDTKGALDHFLADPSRKAHDGRIFIDYLNRIQRDLCSAGFFEMTAEFMEKTRKLRDLEEQIDKF